MHEIRDARKEEYKKGGMQDRWDARLGKTWQDLKDAGTEGCKG